MKEPTPCETCDWLHPDTKKQNPSKWLCMRCKRMPGLSAVAPNVWAEREPYMRCIGINGGACVMWEARREAKKDDNATD